jgi:hypothetical protein
MADYVFSIEMTPLCPSVQILAENKNELFKWWTPERFDETDDNYQMIP